VTAQGSPLSRFRRAVDHGNLFEAEASAREFGRLDLADALELLRLIAEREPHRYERAAIRWHGRLELERPGLTIAESQLALSALAVLPSEGATANALLRHLARVG
jgi:hypothetical protein